jgi:hypothetical protein
VRDFRSGAYTHFIEIRNPGDPVVRDNLIFWAIGTGASMAMGAMTRRTSFPTGDVAVVYRACEGKFAAQYAYGVGTPTVVMVWYPDGTNKYINTPALSKLFSIYNEARDPPIPSSAIKLIAESLKS